MKPDEQIKEIENWLWEQLGENQPSEKERYRVMATISDAGAQISRLIQKTRADTKTSGLPEQSDVPFSVGKRDIRWEKEQGGKGMIWESIVCPVCGGKIIRDQYTGKMICPKCMAKAFAKDVFQEAKG